MADESTQEQIPHEELAKILRSIIERQSRIDKKYDSLQKEVKAIYDGYGARAEEHYKSVNEKFSQSAVDVADLTHKVSSRPEKCIKFLPITRTNTHFSGRLYEAKPRHSAYAEWES